MAAESLVPDLPLWAWNLVIAMQHHEDLHAKNGAPCLDGVLRNVPADVRTQAAAISSYVHKASGDQLADQVTKTFEDVLGSFFGSKAESPQEAEATP